MRLCASMAVMLSLCVFGTAAADVVRVPTDEPTIQAGIDAAGSGDTVLIEDGTYTGAGNVQVTVTRAGITLTSEHGPDLTTIDCEGSAPALTLSDDADTTTIIDGLTFTGGVGDGVVPGGIYFLSAGGKVRDCVFEGNQSRRGAAAKLWSASAVFDGCVFRDNHSTQYAGGIAAYWSLLWVRDCVFVSNTSTDDGGALWIHSGGDISIQRCTLVGNSGSPSGAIGLDNMADTDLVVDACIIAFSPQGKAIDDEFTLTDVYQCCVFGNAGGDSLPDGASENIFLDPRLCDYQNGDVTLCANSPCLPSSGENPWGAPIGALGQGCAACDSPVEATSWGLLKWLHRTND